MKHSLRVTFRRQCSHQCSQSEREAGERESEKDCWYSKEEASQDQLCNFVSAQYAIQRSGTLPSWVWRLGCENLTEFMLCHDTFQNSLCFSCVYCVSKLPWVKASVILCCFSLHSLLLVIINLTVLQQIEKSCAFLLLAGSFYCFVFLLICKQQHSGKPLKPCCIIVFTGSLCVHYFFSATRGRYATAQWTHYFCDHFFVSFPNFLQVLYH